MNRFSRFKHRVFAKHTDATDHRGASATRRNRRFAVSLVLLNRAERSGTEKSSLWRYAKQGILYRNF